MSVFDRCGNFVYLNNGSLSSEEGAGRGKGYDRKMISVV